MHVLCRTALGSLTCAAWPHRAPGAAREDDAIKHAKDALKMDAKNVKAHYRLGQAYTQLGKYPLARDHLSKAEAAAAGDVNSLSAIRAEIERLGKRQERHARERKRALSRMGTGGGEEEGAASRVQWLLQTCSLANIKALTAQLTEGHLWGAALALMAAILVYFVFDARAKHAMREGAGHPATLQPIGEGE